MSPWDYDPLNELANLDANQSIGPEVNQSIDPSLQNPVPVAPPMPAMPAPQRATGPNPLMLGALNSMMGAGSPPPTPYGIPSKSVVGADTPVQASGPNPLVDSELADAQEQDRQRRLSTGIFSALAGGLGTMTGTRPNSDLWKNLSDQGNQTSQQLLQGRKSAVEKMALQEQADSHNPDSRKSIASRAVWSPVAKRLGVDQKTFENLSAADVDDFSKGLLKLDEIKARSEQNQLMRQMSGDKHLEDKLDKTEADFTKALDFEKTSSRNKLGKAAVVSGAADRLNALFDSARDPKTNQINYDKIDPNRAFEIVRGVDNMISSSGATVAGSEHLVPQSAIGDFNSWMNYLKNRPGGAGQGKFLENLHHTIQREKEVSDKQAREYIKTQADISSGGLLGKHRPERVKQISDIYLRHATSNPEDAAPSNNPSPLEIELKKRGLIK